MKKILSIVFDSKDDGFHAKLIERTSLVLNIYINQIKKLKVENKIEILLVDWGSKKELRWKLNLEKNNFVNFCYVDKEIAYKYDKLFKTKYNHDMALNVGVRRASGQNVLFSPSDQFFSLDGLKNLIRLLSKNENNILDKNLFLIPRKFIERGFFLKNPSIIQYEKYIEKLNFSNVPFKSSKIHNGGGMGGFLARKKLFNQIHGPSYPNLKYFGWRSRHDNDLLKRASNLVDHIDLSSKGITMFKLPYENEGERNKLIKEYKKKFINFRQKYIFDLNKKVEWGLPKHIFKISRYPTKKFIVKKDEQLFEDYLKSGDLNFKINNKFKLLINDIYLKEKKLEYIKKNLIISNIVNGTRTFNYIDFFNMDLSRISFVLNLCNSVKIEAICSQKQDYWEYISENANLNFKGYFKCINDKNINAIERFLKNCEMHKYDTVVYLDKKYKKIGIKKKKLINQFLLKNINSISLILSEVRNINSLTKKFDFIQQEYDFGVYINKKINSKELKFKLSRIFQNNEIKNFSLKYLKSESTYSKYKDALKKIIRYEH